MATAIKTVGFDPAVFDELLARYQDVAPGERDARWLLLEAAHVVGQTRFVPHLKTHMVMFGQARHEGDWPEMAGQLMRVALVPLGHALGRLPLGNPGRSTVSAFQTMPVRDDIAQAIASARLARARAE